MLSFVGTIFCRLVAGSKPLRKLCERLLQQISNSESNNVFFQGYWDRATQNVKFNALNIKMNAFKTLCEDIISPSSDDESEPKPFWLPVSFRASSLQGCRTRIYMRVEDQYIASDQNGNFKYALISGFPRFLEGQQQPIDDDGLQSITPTSKHWRLTIVVE